MQFVVCELMCVCVMVVRFLVNIQMLEKSKLHLSEKIFCLVLYVKLCTLCVAFVLTVAHSQQ